MLSVAEAAAVLCVAQRTVYDLAAPGGPIPCHRFGRRILFTKEDLTEYIASCRYIETKRAVVSSLSSTAPLKASESALPSFFRSRGVVPRQTPTTAKKPRASTPLQLVSSARNS
ncbi:helix-turn-helix domain-containing protein [Bordetella avium]|nr:hypothetical protein C0J09_11635 [Bordetella avium]AZY53061.1 hypothetical protein C0J07_11560 [Bordetella avium]RIQ12596.1 helix-turn-helix domain-containing protein [Bordetella avium]RIQ37168.1 helix-turn-helix domain-containing protein [Bordetella avium]RIQ40384.1 helix-turn-helix domain-containing protein [Bordetella avium]